MSIKPPTPAEARAVSRFFTFVADRLEPGQKTGEVFSEADLAVLLAEVGLTQARLDEIMVTPT